MTIARRLFLVSAFVLAGFAGHLGAQAAAPKAPDITGKWTSTFDSQIGSQTYTFDFVAKDGKLTGKLKGNFSDAQVDVTNGKVEGDAVTFVEHLSYQGMEIVVTYTGKIVSADEIKFTRVVAEFVTEEIVAKRDKTAK